MTTFVFCHQSRKHSSGFPRLSYVDSSRRFRRLPKKKPMQDLSSRHLKLVCFQTSRNFLRAKVLSIPSFVTDFEHQHIFNEHQRLSTRTLSHFRCRIMTLTTLPSWQTFSQIHRICSFSGKVIGQASQSCGHIVMIVVLVRHMPSENVRARKECSTKQ